MNMENTIKSLLYRYDCVIVPDFGGFVAKRKSAIFHPIDYKFDPPKKMVGFNSDLVHTDGLLANEFAKHNDLSYQEAIEQIEKEVSNWKATLDNNQALTIPDLGTFTSKNNVIEFEPSENQNFALESFGLSSLRGKYILREEKEVATPKKANAWVSYAAAIGFAFLVGGSSFFANQNLVQNQLSSVLPLLNANAIVDTPNETPVAPIIDVNNIDNNDAVAITPVEETINPTTPLDADGTVEISAIAEEPTVENVTTTEFIPTDIDLSVKKYQVIGGSFKIYSRAMEHQAKLKRQGYDRAIIIGKVGNYFMVAYDTFDDATEAANFKRELERKGKDVFMRP
ncbi:hypothetical protein NMK71_10080 [Weeksellaceae bacterium KMM 9713]|uniref:SPOR domain-containing protein n=2 Tax=Profundicola chukchiensis TaxID=2961959 RepID=A0A9X4N1A7_9FLAO|nr:hypothetical protein [Profundicola chukchiensis]